MSIKMRVISCLLFFYCSLSASAQGVVSFPEYNVLYKGYDNIVVFGAGKKTKSLVLESEQLSISKLTDSSYVLKVNTTNRIAKITVRKKLTKKIVGTFEFRIMNLPSPVVYWGEYKQNSQITLDQNYFSATFDEYELLSNKEFEVQTYEIAAEFMEQPVKGSGYLIKEEAITELKKAKVLNGGKPIRISVMLQVRGPDGILRKKSSEFTF